MQAVAAPSKASVGQRPQSQYELFTLTTWLLRVSQGCPWG